MLSCAGALPQDDALRYFAALFALASVCSAELLNCYKTVNRRPDLVIPTPQPYSSICLTTRPLRAKSLSARLPSSSPSRQTMRLSGLRTTAILDLVDRCGARIVRVQTRLQHGLRQERFSSTTLCDQIRVHPSAESKVRASAASWERSARENSQTPNSSGSRSEPVTKISDS
jgi:hypothetical protein